MAKDLYGVDLREWQAGIPWDLRRGRDVMCIVATGQGKTMVIGLRTTEDGNGSTPGTSGKMYIKGPSLHPSGPHSSFYLYIHHSADSLPLLVAIDCVASI